MHNNNYTIYLCEITVSSQQLNNLKQIDQFPIATYQDSPNTCDFLFLPDELIEELEESI